MSVCEASVLSFFSWSPWAVLLSLRLVTVSLVTSGPKVPYILKFAGLQGFQGVLRGTSGEVRGDNP